MAWMLPLHVLLLVADDCGQELIDAAPTPNLDRLAAEGVSYSHVWSAPLCRNARARILSGLEAWRPGNLVGGRAGTSGHELPTGDLLPDFLPGSSSFYGKLHVALDDHYTWPVEAGFDTWLGSMGNLGGGVGGFYDWEKASEAGPVPETEYATRVIGVAAAIAVTRQDEFVLVSLHDAHGPYDVPPQDMAPVSHTGVLASQDEIAIAKVEAMDTAIGWILERAIPRDYLVIFLSDNSSNPDLSFGGKKGTLTNKGLTVPMIVYHPDLEPGVCGDLVQTTDLFATICNLQGIASPPEALDSVSFIDTLAGGTNGRAFIRSDRFSPNGSPPGPDWKRAIREQDWSLYDKAGTWSLFHLAADPDEEVNLWPPSSEAEQEAVDRLTPLMQG